MDKYPQFNPDVVKALSKDKFKKNHAHHKDEFDLDAVWDYHNPKKEVKEDSVD